MFGVNNENTRKMSMTRVQQLMCSVRIKQVRFLKLFHILYVSIFEKLTFQSRNISSITVSPLILLHRVKFGPFCITFRNGQTYFENIAAEVCQTILGRYELKGQALLSYRQKKITVQTWSNHVIYCQTYENTVAV